ncbi:hypothetical protein ACLB2K_001905 [Fragaria x ananassa]
MGTITVENVVIVGGGIAGLATGVALKRAGIEALVLERSKGLRVNGTALTLFPNAWFALDSLGVSHKLASYTPSLNSDVERTSALQLKVRTSSVFCSLTPATASLLPGRQHRLPGRLLSFQDWPATSFPANLDQSWCFPSRASIRPENLSPASPGRREAVLEACAVVRE